MSVLLEIYSWTIAGGVLAAIALSVLGCWLAARDRAMQTLCLGQGATLGVLLGLGVLSVLHMHEVTSAKPLMFASACLISTLTYFVSEKLVRFRASSQNTYFAFMFAMILAASYLVSALFPGLENHMSQYFFGDLATMSDGDSIATVIVCSCALVLFFAFGRRFSDVTFEESIFSREYARLHHGHMVTLLMVTILLLVSFTVQTVGFLFSAVCLFLPTSMMNFAPRGGLIGHFTKCALLAGTSTASGFILSLQFPNLPTVPTIAVIGLGLGFVVLGVDRLRAVAV